MIVEENKNFKKQAFTPKTLAKTIKEFKYHTKFKPQKAKEIRTNVINLIESHKHPNFGSFKLNHKKFEPYTLK